MFAPLSPTSSFPDTCCSVRDLFLDCLRECFAMKRVPFNTSLINDLMKRRDRHWNVQRELGCSFAQLCQVGSGRGCVREY